MEAMGVKVFLTGGTGFVGANLVRALLREGYDVHLAVRETSKLWRIEQILSRVTLHKCKLENADDIGQVLKTLKPRGIIHLAAYGGSPGLKGKAETISTNLTSFVNLLDAAYEIGFEWFINTGSSSEYGVKDSPMKESDFPNPINLYGVTKLSSTLFAQAYAKKFGLPVVTLRLFSPFGFYEDSSRLIPYIIESMLKKAPTKLSCPSNVRDFIFIEDVIEAYLKVIQHISKFESGDVLNVGSGKQHTILQCFEILKRITGYSMDPQWHSIEPRDSDLAKIWEADISKINSIIGYTPAYSFEQGLSKTVQWFNNKSMEVLNENS